MAIAQFSFGSFGDITSVLQLAFSIRRLLSDARGGDRMIKDTIAYIDTFTQALQSVKPVLEKPNVPASVRNGIAHALDVSQVILQRIQKRIDKARVPFEKSLGKNAWCRYLGSCAFLVLGRQDEVDALKRQLGEQLTAIQTMVIMLTSNAVDGSNAGTAVALSQIFERIDALPFEMRVDVPFHFMDAHGRAVKPIARLSDLQLYDFCNQFGIDTTGLENDAGVLQNIFLPNDVGPGPKLDLVRNCRIYFQLFIYDDGLVFNQRVALLSPVYVNYKDGGTPITSYGMSRALRSACQWLGRTLHRAGNLPLGSRETHFNIRPVYAIGDLTDIVVYAPNMGILIDLTSYPPIFQSDGCYYGAIITYPHRIRHRLIGPNVNVKDEHVMYPSGKIISEPFSLALVLSFKRYP